MSLVRKQCQGSCQRVKPIPEHHAMCDKCFRKVMRKRHRERVADAYRKGYAAGRADALCNRGQA